MKTSTFIKKLSLFIILFLIGISLNAQITSSQTGDWSNTSTWVGGVIPVSTDNVIIASGHTVTATAAISVNNLIIESGATFAASTYTHTISGNWTENGTLTGNCTIEMNASLVQNITVPATFYNLTFNGGSVAVIGANTTVNNDFVITNSTKLTTSYNLTVANNFTVNTGSKYTCDAGTTIFNGSSAQTITIGTTDSEPAANFYAINFDNGGAANPKTIDGNILTSGSTITITTDAQVEDTGNDKNHKIHNLNVTGTCNFSGTITAMGGTFYDNSGDDDFTLNADIIVQEYLHIGSESDDIMRTNKDITVPANESRHAYLVINNGCQLIGIAGKTLSIEDNESIYIRDTNNFPTGFGSITLSELSYARFDLNGAQTIPSRQYGRLVLTYNTKTAAGSLDINSHVYLYNAVTLDLVNYDHTIAGYIYNWDEDWGRGSITSSGGTVTLDAADAEQRIYNAGTGSYTFNNLVLTQSAPTALRYKRFYDDITINGNFTASNAGGDNTNRMIIDFYDHEILGFPNTFSLGSHVAFWTSGENSFRNFTGNFGTCSFDVYSTVRYNRNDGASTVQYISHYATYGNIELYGTGVKRFTDNIDINGNILRVGGTPVLTATNRTMNVAGNWQLAQAYTNLTGSNRIFFDGATTQNISASNFNIVQFLNSGSTKTQTGDWDIAGNLTIDDGVTLNSDRSINIAGNWLENGAATFQQTERTLTFDGTAAQTVSTATNSYFYNFYINKTGASKLVTANSNIDINGTFNFTENYADFDLNGQNLRVEQDFYFREGCTFNHNNGKVFFDGENYAQLIRNYHTDTIVFNDVEFVGTAVKRLYQNAFRFEGDVFINNSTLDGQWYEHFVEGNWINSGVFRHSSNLHFVGSGNQTIGQSSFNTVIFGGGTGIKTLDGDIICNGNLIINDATLDVSASNYNISVEQNWNNDSTGSFIAHQGKVTMLGDWSYIYTGETNTLYGGSQIVTQSGTKSFYNLEINMVEDTWISLRGALNVSNDFTITKGRFLKSYISNDFGINDITVGGSFVNQGTMEYDNYGSIITLNPTTGNHTFNPGSTNSYPPIIFDAAAASSYTFQSNLVLHTDRALTINNGTIDLNSNGIKTNGASGNITLNNGTLEVDSAAIIDMGAGATFTNVGGIFKLTGHTEDPAKIISTDGNYTFVQTAGTIHANNYRVEGTSGNGIDIQGGSIDATNTFQNGTFSNCTGTACFTVSGIDIGAGGRILQEVTFNSGPTYNVQRTSGNGVLTFQNATGSLAGEANDNDPGDLVVWSYPGADFWTGDGDGTDWNDPDNWQNDVVPDINTIVILNHDNVAGAYNVVINSTADGAAKSLNINSNGTAISLTLNGRELEVAEDITIGLGSTLTQTGVNDTIKVGQSWSNEGTFNENSSVVVFNPTSGTHSISTGGASDPFNDLVINGVGGTVNISSNIDINGNIKLLGATLNGGSYTITLAGDWVKNGGVFVPASGTVNFDNTGNQAIGGGDFYNFITSGSGTKTLSANIDIDRDITIQSGTVLDGATYFIYVGDDWTNQATATGFTQTGAGTVIFNSEAHTQNIGQDVAVDADHSTTFNNLTISGTTTKYFQQNTTVNGDLIISNGSPHVLSDVTVTGSGTNILSQTNGTLFIRGTNNFPTSFETISLTGGYVDYYADADQTIYTADYYNLRVRNTTYAADGNIYTKTLAGNISANYIQIYDVETRLDANDYTITLAGDLYVRDGGLEPVWGTNGTIIHNGGSWYIDTDIKTLNNVVKKNNGYLWLRYRSLEITGDVSIQDDAILRMDTTVMNCTAASKTFSMAASARAYIYTGDVFGTADTVAFPTGFANYDLDVNSTVYLRGTENQIIYTTPTYGNLYLYTDAEINMTLDGNLDVNGDFRMYYNNPTLVDNNFDMNIAGAYTDIRKYTPSAGTTITFDGVDQRIVDAAAGATEFEFTNVIFAGSGQKSLYNGGDDWYSVSENLTINNNVTVYLPRRLDFSGSTWLNNGTFNHTTNIVNFTGTSAQAINPGADNTFYAVNFSGAGTKTFNTNGIDVYNGVFEIETSTTVDMGTDLTHEIASTRVDNSGTWITANANFIFDRLGTQYISDAGGFTCKNLTCRRSDQWTRNRYLEGNISVDNLNIEEGIYFLCTTNHDVANYDITLTGNFTNQGYNFRSYENTVYFESNNTDAKTITQGNGSFHNVIFNNSQTNTRTYTLQDQANFYEDLTINSGATLKLNGQILRLGNNDSDDPTEPIAEEHRINAGGTLEVDAGASLQFSCYDLNNTILNVWGTLKVVGTDGNNATITQYQRHRDNRIDISIQNGATIHANYYLMQYISNDGLIVQNGATIDATNNFSNGTWADMNTATGTAKYYLVCDADVSGIGTVDNVTFNFGTTPTQGIHFNVKRDGAATGTLVFAGSMSGLLGGENYEADPTGIINPGLITWPPVSEVSWTGAVSTDWFDANNWTTATIPTSGITAIIPQQANNPVINNTTGAICKDLQITNGFLTLEAGYDLDVDGDIYVGTGTNVGILGIDDIACTINASGSWTRGQNALFVHGDGLVKFDAAGGNVSIDARNSAFGNIEFDGGASFLINRLETLVDKDFTITNGTVSPTVNEYRLKIKGNYNNIGGVYSTITPGYVYFDATADQTITNGTFWDLTIDGSGTKSTVNAMTIDGDLLIQNATLQAGASIDINSYYALIESTGTFNDGGFAHTFGGYRWTGTGAYTGAGSLTFDRNGGQLIYASKFSSLILENNGTVTLYGNITLSNNLEINEPNSYLNIQDYTLTSTSGTFSMGDNRRIYVRGANNFPSGFSVYNFHENSYTMYDGTMPQTITGAPVIYGRVYLDNSAKTLAGNVDIDGILYFYDDASLDVTSNNYRINIEGDWYNNYGATFTPHEGEVIFDGNDDNTYLRVYEVSKDSNPFYKLTVNKGNGYLRSNWTDITIQDNLRVLNGTLYQNQTMFVGGDMSALSGTFYQAGTYYLNKASGSSNLQVNGSILNNLTINSDATYYLQDDLQLFGNFTLTKGTFDGNGNTVGLGNYGETHDISGTYIVGAGGVLKLPNYGTFEVNSGGVVYIVGDASNIATVTNYNGRYYLNIENGGKIYAEHYMFEYMAENGIYIKEGAIIDNNNNFSNGTFTNVAAGGTALRIENSQSFSESGGNPIEEVSFPVNPNGGAYNIMKVNAAAGTIDFKNYKGEFAGEEYDNDPNNLINWIDPPFVTWTGDIDNDWYDAGNWDATTGGDRVPLISDNVIIPQETNQPVITTDGAVAKSINLLENAYLTLNSSAATDTTLVVAEDFDFAGTLIMTDGDDSLAIGGNFNNSGSFQSGTGTVILNSIAGNQALDNYTSSFYNLHISSEAAVLLSRNITVNNEFRIKKGDFDVSANRTLTVKGDFYNNDTYTARSGKLILSGTSANQVFNPGSSAYYNIDINAGASTSYNLTDNDLSVTNIMTINTGTFSLNSRIFNMGDGVSDVLTINGGTFSIDENAYLRMANGASVVVNNGGTYQMVGTDVDNPAYITSQSGTYAFTANSGSTIHALFYNVQFINADGIYLRPGASINGTNNFSDGVFRNGTSGGQFLWFQNDFTSDITVTDCYFHDGASYNIKRQTGNNAIIFEDALGLLEGAAHEIDDGSATTGRVQWSYTHKRYTWTGNNGTDWNDALNWDVEGGGPPLHAVPDNTIIAIIPNVTNDPILNGTNGSVYDLRIENGGFLTISGNTNLDADNTIMVGSGGILTVANSSSSTIYVADIWSIDGSFNHGGSSTVEFNAPGGKVLTITGSSVFYNLTINSGGVAEYNTASSMIIEGTFAINNGIFSISSVNDTLHIGGNWINAATFNHGNAIVDFNGTNQTISNTGTGNFYSVQFNGSNTKTLNSNVTFEGDLYIKNTVTLSGSSYTLTTLGDWTNRGSFSAATGTVYFGGTTPQVVDNNTENSFYNFTLNNTASEFPQVLLYGDIKVLSNGTLTLTDGIIETTITEEFTIEDNIILVGGNTSASYISGPLTKEGNDDFVFPIGDGLKFARIGITGLASNTSLTAQYFESPYNDITSIGAGIDHVSGYEYWNLYSNSGTGTPTVSLYWEDGSQSGIDNLASLRNAQYTGGQWEDKGNGSTTGDISKGSITSASAFTNFGPITFASSVSNQNPLNSFAQWTGSESIVWNNVNNWIGGVPGSTKSARIPSGVAIYPVIDIDAACSSLTLENGASLTVNPLKSLRVNGTFTLDGTFTLKSDASGNAALINEQPISYGGSSSVTAELFISSSQYHYVSSPVRSSDAHTDIFKVDASAPYLNPNFYTYAETNTDADWMAGWSQYTGQMQVMEGYSYYMDRNTTVYFSGEFNSSDRSIAITHTLGSAAPIHEGWNFVGNPYPAPIDWDAAGWTKSNLDNAIYFWNGTNYSYYLGSGGNDNSNGLGTNDGTSIIPSMQGFMVKSTAGGSLGVPESARTTSTQAFYKKQQLKSTIDVIRISVSGNEKTDETAIRFISDATSGFDSKYDAYKLFPDAWYAVPQIYSVLDTVINAAINTLPGYENETIIPIGFQTPITTGVYTITIPEFAIENLTEVYFEDILEGETFDLSTGLTYNFTSDKGEFNDRFRLKFSVTEEDDATDLDNISNIDPEIKIFSNRNVVYLKSVANDALTGVIDVYDLTGVRIESIDNTKEKHVEIKLNHQAAYYIIKLRSKYGVYIEKVLITQ